ncbi:hypothetical protein [Flavobacterium sp.]|uniref:hypothetical protein n=1 Tax=Flavobacterium sp. TaxID=239 RepID=UPI003F699EB0
MIVRELITRSYYLSAIVARDLETVSGPQIADGLELLNFILSEKSGTGRFIPYYDHLQIPSIGGQNQYDISGLIVLDALTFNIDEVRYQMQRQARYRYWGTSRAENIESLPYSYYSERILNGTRIYLYFTPSSQIDFFTATGRFSLLEVSLDDELNDVIDKFYQNYLMYLLAKRICQFNSISFDSAKEQVLQELENNCVDVNPIDFNYKKVSTLSKGGYVDYYDINILKGWRP